MKSVILLSLLMILSLSPNAQSISKTVKVYSKTYQYIDAYKYFENGELNEIKLVWRSKNARYQHIIDIITIYSGDAEELITLIDFMISFIQKEEPGTSTHFEKVFISVEKVLGIKYLYIGADNGYTNLYPKQLPEIKKAILDWTKTDKDYQLLN